MIRRYVKLLAEILRLSWRHYPRVSAGLLAVKVGATVAAPVMALALRAAIDGIIRDDRLAAAVGAVGAAVAFAATMYLRDLDRVLDKMLIDRLGALHVRPQIERDLAHLDGLDHLERTDLLDRVTVLQGSGWRLALPAWTAVAAVFNVIRLGLLLVLLGAAVTPWLLLLLPIAGVPLWFEHRGERLVIDAETATAESYRLQRHLFNLATGPAGGKEIRVAGAGVQIAGRQHEAWTEAVHARFRARVRAAGWQLIGWIVFTAGFGGGLALVVERTAHGHGSVGDLVLAITVSVTLRDSFQAVVFGLGDAMFGRAVVEPYLWLRDYAASARSRGDRPTAPTLHEGIRLDRVSFTYPGTDRPALDDISCELPAGSVVAVVGEYGSGKTTLIKLLTKLYRPDSGQILIDGTDLAELATDAWRDRLSAAFQNFGRFEIRFADTVGVGDLPHRGDHARVTDAVHAADATALVERLPDGLDTQLGRKFDGVELSEGQWQKTALARASMRTEPLLFVLDEPTASLDAPSEQEIFGRYVARARELSACTGAITVIVSHRFSTVTGADRILVLDGGRLVEDGTHEELVALGGRYADLYDIQATAYASA
jgi:ABC-type multidrug transport system fused ATPase/permease subunit